jgi:alanyl-tRNA synthetase
VEDHAVRTFTTTLDHARDLGAVALFGEKYDDFVRVVEIDDFSRELCGGTHVSSTSELGIFKILSESSVGASVRRIEAITGRSAVAYYQERDRLVTSAGEMLGSPAGSDLLKALEVLQARASALKAEVDEFRADTANDVAEQLVGDAHQRGEVAIVSAVVDVPDMDHLLSLVDRVRDRLGTAAVALGSVVDSKAVLVVSASKDVAGVDAGQVAKTAAPVFGGGGGGNSGLGRAGGGDPAALPQAVEAARQALWEAL